MVSLLDCFQFVFAWQETDRQLELRGPVSLLAAVSGDKKSAHLKRLEYAAESLRIFKADLLD